MSAGFQTLKQNHAFNRVFRRGASYRAHTLTLNVFKRRGGGLNRVGYAVARSHGGSVRRNHLKRLLREAYRSLDGEVKRGYDLVLTARAPARLPTYWQVRRDLKRLFIQADLWRLTAEEGEAADDYKTSRLLAETIESAPSSGDDTAHQSLSTTDLSETTGLL